MLQFKIGFSGALDQIRYSPPSSIIFSFQNCDEDFSKKIKPIIDCSKKVLKPEELQFINIPNLLLLDDNNTETILECYNDKNYSIHSTDGTIKIFHFPNLQIEK